MTQKNSLNELYDQLKKFHLSDGLYVIGAVNAALKYGTVKADRKNIPDWIWAWLQATGKLSKIGAHYLLCFPGWRAFCCFRRRLIIKEFFLT